MKKVCMVISSHPRTDGRVNSRMSVDLVGAGYEVTIVCADGLPDEESNGVKIRSIKPIGRVAKKIPFIRGCILRNRTRKLAREVDADIYHIHEPALLKLIKSKRNASYIFDSHEDSLCELLDLPIKTWQLRWRFSRFLLYRRINRWQKKYIPKCDAVISVTPHIVEKLKMLNENIYMITNYPIVAPLETAYPQSRNLIFCGGIQEQWCIENVMDSINQLDAVKFLLAGGHTYYLSLLETKDTFKNVEYYGYLDKTEITRLYARSSVGICCLQYCKQVGDRIGTLGNTKFFEAMERGLPIICTDFELWKGIIDEYKCGLTVNPNNISEIKTAISTILDNPIMAEQMGKNGRKAILEKYNWDTQKETLLKLYNSLSKA